MPIVFRNRLDASNPGSIAWSIVSPTKIGTYSPSWVGYTTAVYDAVSGKTLWYLGRDPNPIIYGTDMFAYDAGDRNWTWLGGTGTAQNPPGGDGSTAVNYLGSPLSPWLSDRHPIDQMAVDTTRGQMYLSRGVAGGVAPTDLWRYTLNADPRVNTWESLTFSTVPGVEVTGSLVYVADSDLFILHGTNSGGFPRTYVWACGSGASSAAQLAAGATTRGEWYLTYTTGTVAPAQSDFCNLVSIPGSGTVLMFNHASPAGVVYEYNIAAKTWTNLSPSNQPSEPATWTASERSASYITSGTLAGKVVYHQTAHATSSTISSDWVYDRAANAWAALPSTGTGPQVLCTQVYDPTINAIVAWTYAGVMWHGVLN